MRAGMNEQAIQKESTAPSAPLDGAAAPCGCSGEQVERIYEYLDGALTVEDLKEIAAHLESCEDCTHESELEQVIRTVVKRGYRLALAEQIGAVGGDVGQAAGVEVAEDRQVPDRLADGVQFRIRHVRIGS